jgi:Acyl-coenzyme A synthetases/AMP-(fatty) acid ligases
MFEGVPNYPDNSRFWNVIDKHKVNIFYTAPTAIRALMQGGDEPVKKTSRKMLRLLGSVGEPINPEAWEWYHRVVGDERCPIVDTWWQTETGGILITPLPARPSSSRARRRGRSSAWCPRSSMPTARCWKARLGQSLHRQILAGADAHGLWRPRPLRADLFLDLQGQVFHRRRLPPRRRRLLLDHRRVDDVINVSGHRMGTAEVESSLVAHEAVRKPRWSAIPTTSRARASMPMSR